MEASIIGESAIEANILEKNIKGSPSVHSAYMEPVKKTKAEDIYGAIASMNPLVLAYIGDVTYEKEVRKRVVAENPNDKINIIHKKTVEFSKAISQSKVVNALKEAELLTDKEWYFVKRGRNTQSAAPKNASVTDYRYATGFETMIGYLDLSGQQKRIDSIIDFAFGLVNGAIAKS